MIQLAKRVGYERWLLVTLLVVAAITHGVNMFNFPAYFDDEGTYLSQAWSTVELRRLAPYTYWYDHAPIGWLIMGIWSLLTGGFFTFGISVNSGRALMLVIHLINTWLLWKVGKKVASTSATALGVLLYIFSPLAISLHRMVFLDNLMMVFILISLLPILSKKRLHEYFLSGFLFGLAALVKETAIFFLPVFIYGLFRSPRLIRHFAVVGWMTVLAITISLYPIFALLRGELFPSGTFFGGDNEHVSLIETLQWQAGRDGGFFLNQDSEFRYTLENSWIPTDPVLVIGGVIAMAVNLAIGIGSKKRRNHLTVGLLGLSYGLYLIRGGIINDQYLIPWLPFLALNIGVMLQAGVYLASRVGVAKAGYAGYAVMAAIGAYVYKDNTGIYTLDQTKNQIEALAWVKSNIEDNRVVAVDAYGLVDLFEKETHDPYSFKGPQHYWKLDPDPGIYQGVLDQEWKNIEYIVATSKLRHDIRFSALKALKTAYQYSEPIESFENSNPQLSSLYGRRFFANILIANGERVEVRKRLPIEEVMLYESWQGYKKDFIQDYGQVVDPNGEVTTSEGQAYAMLRAVWVGDKEMFDGVWKWTKDHLQHRDGDKLLSWKWAKADGEWNLADYNAASDADIDAALALLLAERRWGDQVYRREAMELITSIWEQEVVRVGGTYYVLAGNDAETEAGFLTNPSYWSPAHYRMFAQVDSRHDWEAVARDTYSLLARIQSGQQLPPNWLLVNPSSGLLLSAEPVMGGVADVYGWDAFRVYWRVALDAVWFDSPDAKEYLAANHDWFEKQWRQGMIAAEYTTEGEALADYQDKAPMAAAIAVGHVNQGGWSNEMLQEEFFDDFNYQEQKFVQGKNYYAENWAWFGLALEAGKLQAFSRFDEGNPLDLAEMTAKFELEQSTDQRANR